MEASKAGSAWPVSRSRQCLEVGIRWLNAGGLEEEEEQEEENKEDRVSAGTLPWMCAASASSFWPIVANNTGHFFWKGCWLHPSPFPLPKPLCFLHSCSSSALALSCLHRSILQGWNCLLLCLYSTCLAEALRHCCSKSDYGEQLREGILARSAWESAAPSPGLSQRTAVSPFPAMNPRADHWQGALLKGSRCLVPLITDMKIQTASSAFPRIKPLMCQKSSGGCLNLGHIQLWDGPSKHQTLCYLHKPKLGGVFCELKGSSLFQCWLESFCGNLRVVWEKEGGFLMWLSITVNITVEGTYIDSGC